MCHLPSDDTWSGKWLTPRKLTKWCLRRQRKLLTRLEVTFNCQLQLFMFIVWLSKQINVFLIGFHGGAGFTGFHCRPWTLRCTDYCHWPTRTPWSCACCWSRCHDQTILWTGSKDLPHVFVHGSERHGAVDAKNQGPAGGVDHRKSDSTSNVVL